MEHLIEVGHFLEGWGRRKEGREGEKVGGREGGKE